MEPSAVSHLVRVHSSSFSDSPARPDQTFLFSNFAGPCLLPQTLLSGTDSWLSSFNLRFVFVYMRRVLSACAGGRSGEGGPYLSAACLFRVPLFRRDLVTSHPAFGRRRAAQPARGPRPALTGLLSQAFIGQTTLLFGCRNAHHRRSGCKSCQDPIHESSGPARTPQVAYSGNRHAPPCWTTVERLSPCSPRHAQGLRFCFFFLGFSLLFPLFFFRVGAAFVLERTRPASLRSG